MRTMLLLAVCLLLPGCSGVLSGGGTPGTPPDGPPPPPTDGQLFLENPPPPTDGTQPPPSDLGPLPSGPLPTFVNLDWNAFPKDNGPNYPVSGKTIVVKTTGSDSNPGTDSQPLKTINAAMKKAASGDLIRVHGGTYPEGEQDEFRAIVITKSNLIITAAQGETVTVVGKTSAHTYGICVSTNDVVINGINLKGFTPIFELGNEGGVQRNIVISNLTIEAPTHNDFFDGIVNNVNNGGSVVSEGLLVKNVVIKGVHLPISCGSGPCNDWRMENLKIIGPGVNGNTNADGVSIAGGDNYLVYRVEVSEMGGDGIDIKAKRAVVWDCHVHNVARNGVKLWDGGDMVNTRIHHTGADASFVTEYGGRYRILHSLIAFHNKGGLTSYNATFGYDSQQAQDIEIINSIFYNTSGGTYFNAASQGKVKIENSIFYGMDNGEVIQIGSNLVRLSDGAGKIKTLGMGDNNYFVDPKLDGSTFHLQSGSPAANKGKQLTATYPKFDCLGQPRVKGAAPDIGPFEDF